MEKRLCKNCKYSDNPYHEAPCAGCGVLFRSPTRTELTNWQPEEVKEMEKNCGTCKHYHRHASREPCYSCEYSQLPYSGSDKNWQPADKPEGEPMLEIYQPKGESKPEPLKLRLLDKGQWIIVCLVDESGNRLPESTIVEIKNDNTYAALGRLSPDYGFTTDSLGKIKLV